MYKDVLTKINEELPYGLRFEQLKKVIKDKEQLNKWYNLLSDWQAEKDLIEGKNFRTYCEKCDKFSCFYLHPDLTKELLKESSLSESKKQEMIEDTADDLFMCPFCFEYSHKEFPCVAKMKRAILNLINDNYQLNQIL